MTDANATGQTARILEALRRGDTLTALDALDRFGCFRLGARIWDLKQAGHVIVTEWESDGRKRWARYRLIPPMSRGQPDLFMISSP